MTTLEDKCFVLSCDFDFKLLKILKEKNIKVHLDINEQVVKMIDQRDYSKFLDFMLAVRNEEAVFNYEMSLVMHDGIITTMSFAGILINGQYVITAFSNYLDLYEELLGINNTQTNRLREKMKQYFSTQTYHQEFMEINNDLINIQREMQKKNATIEDLLLKTNRMNAELHELNATKDRLFSIIGHDLRAPLANIIESLNLVSSNQITYDKMMQIGFFQDLSKSAGLTIQMLENVLEWSRIQLGEQAYKPVKIRLNELVEPIIHLYEKIANDKNVQISEKTGEPIEVFADPRMMEVVFRNLISNAIKFTKSSGEITLSIKSENGYAWISIEDNGIGMSTEKLANLFSHDIGTLEVGTNGEKGTGFGLLLCNRFIKDNKGMLTIKSMEGKGSVFSFSIPLARQ